MLEVLIDSRERYPWAFTAQQATTRRQALRAGDYAVAVAGTVVTAVDRKSLADLVATLPGGKLRYLLAALAEVPRAALVVEDRCSAVFKLDRVGPAIVAEGIAEAQVRFPGVPIVFGETRPVAQEKTYRFLGAALAHHVDDQPAADQLRALPAAGPLRVVEPTTAEIRMWARQAGLEVAARGRVRAEIVEAYREAHRGGLEGSGVP